ncbi:complement factor H-like [Salminus brasiliensis]|uniref:complement factor H-like n=1 Tax=Salminus brasiliensis TaxID=930266 RepID=UPI003B8381ED
MLPVVDNGDISPMSLKSNYTQGDKLLYTCRHGYTSLGKIIYVCNKNEWVNIRNGKCSRKRCELPADIPNGRFVIVNGTDFVYGATIKYICNKGYQMVSRLDTRTCLVGGWDNRLPHCEELSCLPPATEGNIIVDGLSDFGGPLRYGHRVQFTCNSPGLKLVGLKEVICKDNGEWSGPLPRCNMVLKVR